MEDARKSAAAAALRPDPDAKPTSEERTESFVAFLNEPGEAQTGTDSTSNRALDRWFKERQKHQGAPRLLEIPNEALITAGGPIQITGNITLVNEDGSIRYANHLTLCRCGSSQAKPECSGAHLDREFLHPGKFSAVSDVASSSRPSKITISLIKDGPVTFRGRLRMHNQFGQECTKMRGSLCRCGQSANKPFCDGSHERTGFKSGR
jgi:CDGSH-type Zn-finger protein